ncbi:DNA cytosine methyltransferase [Amycolatopsis aidingensis]|uniref:DNA cytosine methyltransferase n=1 Tax=Amycolatopsis aidingensis TaxID=2842453 RepID=UPI001C0E64CD|nr:DNA cytosine methyltransferase [Amycolatopsis aidingensis]
MASQRDLRRHSGAERELVIGSLCTGYGGLDLGVLAALDGGRTAWVADPDPHIRAVLATRMSGVPNLGDITTVDWNQVEPVDVLTAGFPCQDISAAGRGAGIRKGTRSGIWHQVVAAVRHLRPAMLVVENVAALRWRKGGLDVVLGDLAEVGYDAHWTSVRASDIGAPHRRERVFLLAYPAGTRFTAWPTDPAGTGLEASEPGGSWAAGTSRDQSTHRRLGAVADPAGARRHPNGVLTGLSESAGASGEPARRGDDVPANPGEQQSQRRRGPNRLASAARPAPGPEDQRQWDGDATVDRGSVAADSSGQRHRHSGSASGHGIPSATVAGGAAAVPDSSRNRRYERQPEPARLEGRFDLVLGGGPAAGDGPSRSQPQQPGRREDLRLRAGSAARGRDRRGASSHRTSGIGQDSTSTPASVDWGTYEAAIRRWEAVLGVAAPHPTEPNRNGRARLSPAFVEWLMGLSAGWVTDVEIPRTAQLRALGNGVVPQQAAFAVHLMLADLLALDAEHREGSRAA